MLHLLGGHWEQIRGRGEVAVVWHLAESLSLLTPERSCIGCECIKNLALKPSEFLADSAVVKLHALKLI